MKKCNKQCTPCCDFCIYAYHEYIQITYPDGYRYIKGGPIGCIIHYDEAHQKIAKLCGWCNDYYCYKQFKEDTE